jgi:hypothetical protein
MLANDSISIYVDIYSLGKKLLIGQADFTLTGRRGRGVSSSYLCTYDLYGPVRNVFDACKYIMRAIGRGLGPGKREFFGSCEMASSR